MSNGTGRESQKGSARLPLALIFLTIAGLAGLVLWLTLAPPPPPAPRSSVQISFGTPPAKPAAKPAAPAKPKADPPATAAAPAVTPVPPKPPPPPPIAPPRPDPAPAALKLPPTVSGPAPSVTPDSGLLEPSRHGPLPIVGRDGREAWRAYARPIDTADKKPRIALVLQGLGMNATATRTAIHNLPGAITLAFTPYASELNRWIASARAAGHEALMMVPMEAANFPISDPGPRALLTSLSATENTDRLEWILARATGYVGVTEQLGSRFITSRQHMNLLFQALRKRGLLFLAGNRRSSDLLVEIADQLRLPIAVSTLNIDLRAKRALIDSQLAELERLASSSGQAIGMGSPYPITIKRLMDWAGKLKGRGFTLTPLSALTTRAGP